MMPLTTEDRTTLDSILERNGRNPDTLIQMLQDVQAEVTYLPEDHLRYISDQLAVPITRVFHVATFYKAFSLRPRGKHVITICRGTACHVRGSQQLVETVERELGLRDGETTEDLLFTLECVNCLGACALAPVVVIDQTYYEKVTSDRLLHLIDEYRNGGPPRDAQAEAADEPAPDAQAQAPPAPEPSPAQAAPAPEPTSQEPEQTGPSRRELRRRTRKQKRQAKRAKAKKPKKPRKAGKPKKSKKQS